MAKRKYPSELNTRSIRVNIGDWRWLNSLSKSLGITVAQAFHKVITGQDHKEPVHPAQIPMPAFRLPGIQAAGVTPGAPTAGVTPGGVVAGVKIFPSIKLRATVAGEEHTNGA